MLQVRNLTTKEKRKAYRKLKKRDLIEMLIENNRIIESLEPYTVNHWSVSPYYTEAYYTWVK